MMTKLMSTMGNPTVGLGIGTGTTATAGATILEQLPTWVGLGVTLLGGVLTLVSLYAVVSKHKAETREREERKQRERELHSLNTELVKIQIGKHRNDP